MVGAGIFALLGAAGEHEAWAKVFAALIIIVMTVNIVGSQLVARAQTVVVYVVLGILSLFAIVTLVNMNPSLLAPSGYPPLKDIVSSVALTFFAFLGFGIITFTAKDLAKPSRQLPRAMYIAVGIATVTYVTIALGVFGTLIHEPASIVALVVILMLSIALDYWWKRSRTSRAGHVQVSTSPMEQR